jgi:hypothetical protein
MLFAEMLNVRSGLSFLLPVSPSIECDDRQCELHFPAIRPTMRIERPPAHLHGLIVTGDDSVNADKLLPLHGGNVPCLEDNFLSAYVCVHPSFKQHG